MEVPEKSALSKLLFFFAGFLIIAAGLVVYHRTLRYPFVYDDFRFVVSNEGIRTLRPFSKFFLNPAVQASSPELARQIYRPLNTMSYALTYRFFGLDPRPYHALNVMFHILNGLLIFFFTLKILPESSLHFQPAGKRKKGANLIARAGEPDIKSVIAATAAGLLFVLHPVQTESAAWISQRSGILSQFFFLVGLILYLRFRESILHGTALWIKVLLFIAVNIFYFLSLLCKESAAVFPLIILAFEWFWAAKGEMGGGENSRKKQLFILPVCALCLAVIFMTIRRIVLGQVAQTDYWAGSFYSTCLTMVKGFAYYIKLLFLPFPLSIDYPFAFSRSVFDPLVLLSARVIALVLCIGLLCRKKYPLVTFAVAWFFISLAPVSNIIPIYTIINERFLYLPIVGFALLFAHLANKIRSKSSVILFVSAVIMPLGILSYSRAGDWSDEYSLFLSAVKAFPESGHSNFGLGNIYFSREEYTDAARCYKAAMSAFPGDLEIKAKLAEAYAFSGQYADAVELSLGLLRTDPENVGIRYNLAVCYMALGMKEDARNELNTVLNLKPGFPPALKAMEKLLQN